MGEEIGEGDEIGFAQAMHLFGHGGAIADANAGFVVAQRLGEVVLALAGEPRVLILSGEVGLMTAEPFRSRHAFRNHGGQIFKSVAARKTSTAGSDFVFNRLF